MSIMLCCAYLHMYIHDFYCVKMTRLYMHFQLFTVIKIKWICTICIYNTRIYHILIGTCINVLYISYTPITLLFIINITHNCVNVTSGGDYCRQSFVDQPICSILGQYTHTYTSLSICDHTCIIVYKRWRFYRGSAILVGQTRDKPGGMCHVWYGMLADHRNL